MENTVFKFRFILDKEMRITTFRIGNTRLVKGQLLHFKKNEDENVLEGKLTASHYNKNNVELSVWGVGKPGTRGTFWLENEEGSPLFSRKIPLKTLAGGRFRFFKKNLPSQPAQAHD